VGLIAWAIGKLADLYYDRTIIRFATPADKPERHPMSIFSEWRNGKLTWEQAASQAAAYVAAFVNHSPAVKALVDAEVVVFKQAASNAIAMVDTAAPPLINASAVVVANETRALLTAYVGPIGAVAISPAAIDAINIGRDALIAEIHAAALQFKADCAADPPTAAKTA
jgi:hypothetical protein